LTDAKKTHRTAAAVYENVIKIPRRASSSLPQLVKVIPNKAKGADVGGWKLIKTNALSLDEYLGPVSFGVCGAN